MDSVYYATPEIEHRLELVKHLTDFSDRILLLTGESGIGKTAFLQRLRLEADERWKITGIDIYGNENPEDVLKSIHEQNYLEYRSGESVQHSIQTLHNHFANNTQNSLVNVLLIDDAHRLTASILNLLIQLSDPSASGSKLHLLMMSEEDISSLSQQDNGNHLHKMDIPALTVDQLPIYLRQRIGTADIDFDHVFSQDRINQIHKTSGGVPARINLLAAQVLQDPSLSAGRRSPRSIPVLGLLLNGRVTLVLSLILVTAFIVHVLSQEEVEETEVISLDLPGETETTFARQEYTPQPVGDAGEGDSLNGTDLDETGQEPAAMIPDEQAQVIVLDDPEPGGETVTVTLPEPVPVETDRETPEQPVPMEPVTEPESVTGQSEAESMAAATPPEAVPVEVEPEARVTAEPAGFRDAAWLNRQAPEKYVLQLMGAHDPAIINKLLMGYPSINDQVARFTTVNNNKPWHVLVYGLFSNRDEALASVASLPGKLRALGPWPRSLASIQQDLR
ncbi:MAG: AAA family ATPase [Thiotrichales bacterium]|nr:AAA family ATPase [Thiotrichales bacterium]